MADVRLTIVPGMVRDSVLEGGGVGDITDVDGVNNTSPDSRFTKRPDIAGASFCKTA